MKSYQQTMDHTCGACCVMDVCDHFGLPVLSERTLARKLHARYATGIEPWRIAEYLSGLGLTTEYKEEKNIPALLRRMEAGWLPIVCWADWGGHYCVAYDVREFSPLHIMGIFLADPACSYDGSDTGFDTVSLDRFKSMWYTPRSRKVREVIYVKDERIPQSDL